MVSERQRHQYLSVFGIDQYIPSRCLPGAKPSVLLADEDLRPIATQTEQSHTQQAGSPVSGAMNTNASNTSSHTDTSVTHEPQQAPRMEFVEDECIKESKQGGIGCIIEGIDLKEQHQQEPSFKPEAVTSKSASSSTVRFVLTIWRIADDCLVIDSRQPASALPTDRLLQNMLRAIGYPLTQLPPSEIIRWPVFRQDPLANDEEQARAMVQAFISAQNAKSALSKIILMGEPAATFTLNTGDSEHEQDFAAACGAVHTHPGWPAKIAVTPSLDTMLHEPMTKALAWQALKQL